MLRIFPFSKRISLREISTHGQTQTLCQSLIGGHEGSETSPRFFWI